MYLTCMPYMYSLYVCIYKARWQHALDKGVWTLMTRWVSEETHIHTHTHTHTHQGGRHQLQPAPAAVLVLDEARRLIVFEPAEARCKFL